jgi:hypothetical protein
MADQSLGFDELAAANGNKIGVFDIPCSACSPLRKAKNQRLKCMRVWHNEPDFLSYNCCHCGISGYAHSGQANRINPIKLRRLRIEAENRAVAHTRDRCRKAGWLWCQGLPIVGTIAEKYLRARGITCTLPATLRFLPAREQHPPAMVAAFGIPDEPEPGMLNVIDMAIYDVHVTRRRYDGSGKADIDGPTKIMIAPSSGLPIVLAPVNDVGGLVIAEGIEDALSMHQGSNLGAWAAGCASRLPALARVVPDLVESVTIVIDDDGDGRRYGYELAHLLRQGKGSRFEIRTHEARREAAAA